MAPPMLPVQWASSDHDCPCHWARLTRIMYGVNVDSYYSCTKTPQAAASPPDLDVQLETHWQARADPGVAPARVSSVSGWAPKAARASPTQTGPY